MLGDNSQHSLDFKGWILTFSLCCHCTLTILSGINDLMFCSRFLLGYWSIEIHSIIAVMPLCRWGSLSPFSVQKESKRRSKKWLAHIAHQLSMTATKCHTLMQLSMRFRDFQISSLSVCPTWSPKTLHSEGTSSPRWDQLAPTSLCGNPHLSFPFFFGGAILGFELRALHLLD
jgi:hypothetical protein